MNTYGNPNASYGENWTTYGTDGLAADRAIGSHPPIPTDPASVALGTDFTAVPDLQLSLHSGWPNLREAILRRLTTPRGSLFYDPHYGLDLREWLNEAITPGALYQLERLAALEVQKDTRILRATATALELPGRKLRLTIQCETRLGPYRLIAEVDSITVEVLRDPVRSS